MTGVLGRLGRARIVRPALVDDAGLDQPERRACGEHDQRRPGRPGPGATGPGPAGPGRAGGAADGRGSCRCLRRSDNCRERADPALPYPAVRRRQSRTDRARAPLRRLARPWPFVSTSPRPELELHQLCGLGRPQRDHGGQIHANACNSYQDRTRNGPMVGTTRADLRLAVPVLGQLASDARIRAGRHDEASPPGAGPSEQTPRRREPCRRLGSQELRSRRSHPASRPRHSVCRATPNPVGPPPAEQGDHP